MHTWAITQRRGAAETSGPQAATPDESGRRGAKGRESDSPELYRVGAQ